MEAAPSREAFLRCCGSKRFSSLMVAASPFSGVDSAIRTARDIWLNSIDMNGWLEAFASHPDIGATAGPISQWSKEEQSSAMASATNDTSRELMEWNARYREKFGFVFLICASGKGTPEILDSLKERYLNRPYVELEIAAMEELKIIELRLSKLFEGNALISAPTITQQADSPLNKFEGPIGAAHATDTEVSSADKPAAAAAVSEAPSRTRPPITSHVLDVSSGCPAKGIEVHLEMWNSGDRSRPSSVGNPDSMSGGWVLKGSSATDSDGRCGHLMDVVGDAVPGFYRISFDTGDYAPSGFFPYVSVVFEIRESQKSEHFHVPLLLSPFSFTTYRGS